MHPSFTVLTLCNDNIIFTFSWIRLKYDLIIKRRYPNIYNLIDTSSTYSVRFIVSEKIVCTFWEHSVHKLIDSFVIRLNFG